MSRPSDYVITLAVTCAELRETRRSKSLVAVHWSGHVLPPATVDGRPRTCRHKACRHQCQLLPKRTILLRHVYTLSQCKYVGPIARIYQRGGGSISIQGPCSGPPLIQLGVWGALAQSGSQTHFCAFLARKLHQMITFLFLWIFFVVLAGGEGV